MKILTALLLYIFYFSPSFADTKTISVATLEFSPYVSRALPNNGWAWEIAETAFSQQGYIANLEILPWGRALKMVQDGRIDALYLANINEERKKWASFSDPVGEEISVAFKLKSNQIEITELSELGQYRVTGLIAAHVTKKMQNLGIAIDLTTDLNAGIKRLYYNRTDLLVTDRYAGAHLIRTGFPSQYLEAIDFVSMPIDVNQLHLAVSKQRSNYSEIVSHFNEGLKQIRDDGTYDEILSKHGFAQ